VCNWTVLTVVVERQFDCYVECVIVQHMECTDSVQCSTELYWQLLQRDIVPVMLSVLPQSTFTLHILYKMCSLQLNCTYSNYTEAAATSSAAQQHTNSLAGVYSTAAQLLFWRYIVTHPEISSFRLTLLAASAVTQFDSDKEQVDIIMVTDKLCKLKGNSNNFILKCQFVWKFSKSYKILQ
jgi:hypothetical protein